MLNIRREDARFLGACFVELGLGLAAIMIGLWMGPDPRNLIPHWKDDWGIATGFGWGAAAGVVLAGVMLLVGQLPIRPIQQLNEMSAFHLMELLRGLSTSQLIVLALSAGVGEELLFRGWLMQVFTGDMTVCTQQEVIVAIFGSSIIFGFAHPMSVTYVIMAILMGIALGSLYWFTQNLLAPIVAHWFYDAILMVLMVRSRKGTAGGKLP